MSLTRALLTTVVVGIAVLGPTLFMASLPCLDCDGVCGAAVTGASVDVPAVLLVLPLTSEPHAQIPSTPVRLSELPPRPLRSTV